MDVNGRSTWEVDFFTNTTLVDHDQICAMVKIWIDHDYSETEDDDDEEFSHSQFGGLVKTYYPLVNIQKAIENGNL